jgi:integrase
MTTKIGARDVAALEPNSILWDAEVRGLCARRQFSNVVTYSVIFRNREGRQHWYKLGRHPILTPSLARHEAIRVLRSVTLGEDPSAERRELRTGITVAQLCDEYSARENGKKAATIRSDNSRIKLHIKPKLGKLRVASITSEQIEDFARSLSVGSQARCIGLLGVMFTWAVKRKLRPDNPVRGVDKPKDVKRMRRLSDGEYAQLGSALRNSSVSDIFLLLAVTGWRSSEARLLKWNECDLERSTAILGDTKSGVSIRPLSGAAVDIIKRQPQSGAYVFEQIKGNSNLRHQWLKLGMSTDVTQHTLRHSFASLGHDLGLSDSTIASLIGHKGQSITSRYLHGSDKALIEAADKVAIETLRLMKV